MLPIPEDTRYFEQYRLISRTVPQTPANGHARWPEGSGAQSSGSNPVVPLIAIGSSSRKRRKRSLSTESAELRGHLVDSVKNQYAEADDGVIDFDAGSHAAQLKRQSNAQATKRSRTRLKTMKEELDESKKRERQEKEQRLQERELRLKAEEKVQQEREQRLKAEAENKTLRQKLDNQR
ncbi:hypothetical protein E4U13_008379 [Claviceps humidiphila]|uniref:BZIP domain-containing protein n=1 Tax=Claviceps humidiphila TaxID=1294629 RepID=A0A9P7PTC2_9HYPO|nr:hypothetical protein E4U13_008379 [Claviceps humidiphila]